MEKQILELIKKFDNDVKGCTTDGLRNSFAKSIYSQSPILKEIWKESQKELLNKLTKIVYPKVVCGSLTMASVHRTMKLKKLLEEYK